MSTGDEHTMWERDDASSILMLGWLREAHVLQCCAAMASLMDYSRITTCNPYLTVLPLLSVTTITYILAPRPSTTSFCSPYPPGPAPSMARSDIAIAKGAFAPELADLHRFYGPMIRIEPHRLGFCHPAVQSATWLTLSETCCTMVRYAARRDPRQRHRPGYLLPE